MSSARPTILICVGAYLPGYRGGGPIRSLSNLVDNLSDSFDFKVLTLDHDLGADTPFSGIEHGEWQQVGRASVRYLSSTERLLPGVIRVVNKTPCSGVYLNALYPTPVSTPVLIARRLGLLTDVPIIVCPRGHLNPGALAKKPIRKRLYLKAAKALGLYRTVLWHATNEEEAAHIRSHFGAEAHIQVAPNLGVSRVNPGSRAVTATEKEVGRLRAVFLSRIAPEKNLLGALRFLHQVKGELVFNVYGPIEDDGYWARCEREIAKLPAHVRVDYHGAVNHDRVFDIFADHDLLLLPTHGESFGHAIFEALSAGCPVLISDQTPWRNLAELDAGWDTPLDSPLDFKNALQWCIDASADDYQRLREGARRLARTAMASEGNVSKVRKLFERAIAER